MVSVVLPFGLSFCLWYYHIPYHSNKVGTIYHTIGLSFCRSRPWRPSVGWLAFTVPCHIVHRCFSSSARKLCAAVGSSGTACFPLGSRLASQVRCSAAPLHSTAKMNPGSPSFPLLVMEDKDSTDFCAQRNEEVKTLSPPQYSSAQQQLTPNRRSCLS